MRSVKRYTIFDTSDFTQAAFTAAVSDVITSTAHGLKVGDVIEAKSSTTLPAGMSATTPYYVIEVPSADTFKVSATKGGTTINVTDTGTGTHTWLKQGAGKAVCVTGLDYLTLSLDTDGGGDAAMTFKVVVSTVEDGEDIDFDKAQSTTNRYDYAVLNDTAAGTATAGGTGVILAGADAHKLYSVGVDNIDWITVKVSGRTEGEAKITLTAIEE